MSFTSNEQRLSTQAVESPKKKMMLSRRSQECVVDRKKVEVVDKVMRFLSFSAEILNYASYQYPQQLRINIHIFF